MGCVYEGEWCKSSSKFILPFSRLQWGVEIYGPYYSNYLQVMSSKSQLGMSLWLVKTSHLKAISYQKVFYFFDSRIVEFFEKKSFKIPVFFSSQEKLFLLVHYVHELISSDSLLS